LAHYSPWNGLHELLLQREEPDRAGAIISTASHPTTTIHRGAGVLRLGEADIEVRMCAMASAADFDFA
jgi:hypothetical protein